MIVARVWMAAIEESRSKDYERFAREVSLPMFKRQPGYAGLLMFRAGADCVVLTLWHSKAEADALSASPAYKSIVAEIQAQGFMTGSQNVELFDVHLADVAGFGPVSTPPA